MYKLMKNINSNNRLKLKFNYCNYINYNKFIIILLICYVKINLILCANIIGGNNNNNNNHNNNNNNNILSNNNSDSLSIISTTTVSSALISSYHQQQQFNQNKHIKNEPPNCSDLNLIKIFESRGIKSSEIPKKLFNEMVLRYCELPATGTCCTYQMENKLAMSSRQQLDKNLKDLLNKLSSVLGTRAQKFNDFFQQLLAESKKEFHAMFKRTYGVIYEQNAYVFSDLFSELEKYYSRGKVDLSEAMDSFFNTLYQKMFTVLNAQYTFDDKYLGCVSEHMKELKPFGDVPDKLSVQIKRSFVATRTFAQAVYTASDILKKITNIRLNADCTGALTKMQQCGVCKGHVEKPCTNYCVNVVKGCLQYFNELDTEWDSFVNAIERVSDRLLGPFNIVMVVEPINIKISEAIMNFQETGQEVSNQVFQGCGRPVLGRRKRNVDSLAVKNKSLLNKIKYDQNLNGEQDILDIDASLENEIVLTSDRVKRSADSDKNLEEKTIPSPDYQNMQQQPKARKNNNNNNNNNKNNNENNNQNENKRKNKNKKKQQQNNRNENEEYTNREPVIDKLIKDIKQKVKDSRKFWTNLPYQICNHENLAASPDLDQRCWNGSAIDRYIRPIVSEHGINPEFPSNHNSNSQNSKNHGSNIVGNQLYYLKIAINHLKNAYNGLDVDWSDQEETEEYDNGSGSGDTGIIDEDRDDDDDNDEIGSGVSPKINEDIKPDIKIPSIKENNININNEEVQPEIIIPKHTDKNHRDSNNINKAKESSSSRLKVIPLRRAIVMYLFPIYLAWFGGIFNDLL